MARPARMAITEEVIAEIEGALIEGHSAPATCKAIGLPLRTWERYVATNRDVYKRIRRARNAGHGNLFDGLVDIPITTSEEAAIAKAKAYLIEMRAKRLAPHKYGDKQTIKHDVVKNFADQLRAARERAGIR